MGGIAPTLNLTYEVCGCPQGRLRAVLEARRRSIPSLFPTGTHPGRDTVKPCGHITWTYFLVSRFNISPTDKRLHRCIGLRLELTRCCCLWVQRS